MPRPEQAFEGIQAAVLAIPKSMCMPLRNNDEVAWGKDGARVVAFQFDTAFTGDQQITPAKIAADTQTPRRGQIEGTGHPTSQLKPLYRIREGILGQGVSGQGVARVEKWGRRPNGGFARSAYALRNSVHDHIASGTGHGAHSYRSASIGSNREAFHAG
jgi:hypothetical protein